MKTTRIFRFLLFVLVILIASISTYAQPANSYELAINNGIYLSSDDSKIKNDKVIISFKLLPNSIYNLRISGDKDVLFKVEDATISGAFNEIEVVTGDSKMLLIMTISGKGKYAYALGFD